MPFLIDWKAVVTALVVLVLVNVPISVVTSLMIQPWIARRVRKRERAYEQLHAPTKCARCERTFPAWFVPSGSCRHCSATAHRLPRPDEEPEDFDRDLAKVRRRAGKGARENMALAEHAGTPPLVELPPTDPAVMQLAAQKRSAIEAQDEHDADERAQERKA